MKKIFSVTLILCLILTMLAGCGNASKIRKLENQIAEYEQKIAEQKDELDDWQEIYDDALDTYNRYSYSSDYAKTVNIIYVRYFKSKLHISLRTAEYYCLWKNPTGNFFIFKELLTKIILRDMMYYAKGGIVWIIS